MANESGKSISGGLQSRLSYIADHCWYDQGRNKYTSRRPGHSNDWEKGSNVSCRVTDEKFQAFRHVKRVSELLCGEDPTQNFSLEYSNTIIFLHSDFYSSTKQPSKPNSMRLLVHLLWNSRLGRRRWEVGEREWNTQAYPRLRGF